MIVLLMGVAGSGKTTVGELLSAQMSWPFFDADSFHTAANKERMSQGIPLNDEDRLPWLQNIHSKMLELSGKEENGIFACSALKAQYRELLREGIDPFLLVHLQGDKEIIRSRIGSRKGHFMPASQVENQFATLEEPEDAIVMDVSESAEDIVEQLVEILTEL